MPSLSPKSIRKKHRVNKYIYSKVRKEKVDISTFLYICTMKKKIVTVETQLGTIRLL